MRQPEGYTAEEIKQWDVSSQSSSGKWEPSRPEPRNCAHSWHWRITQAWDVLTGKADALYWQD